MQPILFDTSVYIPALRRGDEAVLQTRNIAHGIAHGSPLWLSAVVLEELYAGAAVKGRKRLAGFERDFVKVNRLLVPLKGCVLSGSREVCEHEDGVEELNSVSIPARL